MTAGVAGIRVGPITADRVGLTLVLTKRVAAACEGRVRGTLTFFGAATGAPVEAALARGRAGCEVPISMVWASIPAEALQRARLDSVEIQLRGDWTTGGASRPVEWNGTIPRAGIGLTESMRVTLRRFVKVPELDLGRVGFRSTTVNADVGVLVPLRFDLRVVEARCDVQVNGKRVASGGREKFILHAARENRLQIPITMDNGALVAAAGKTVLSGGKVKGLLSGHARIRLPGGDVDLPFELPVQLSVL